VSAFPNPPIFYKKYAPIDDKEPTKWDPTLLPPPIPADLEDPLVLFDVIIHPPFPTKDDPHVYGEPRPQLYSRGEIDIKVELKKLNRSLIFNFHHLLEVLVSNPEQFHAQIVNIELILANMHHLLNYYRPHQALSYIATVLEDQINKKKTAIESLKKIYLGVADSLQTTSQTLADAAGAPPEDGAVVPMDTAAALPPASAASSTGVGQPTLVTNGAAAASSGDGSLSHAAHSGPTLAEKAAYIAALQETMTKLLGPG
jgi:hypothetical protein